MRSSIRVKQGSRLYRLIIDVFIVIGIASGIIIVGEVLLRMFLPQNLIGTRITGMRFSERDQVLGIRYIPGATWRFTHPEYQVEYSINEHGFRDAKVHPIPKPDGTTRVLLLGDSFTFGQAVSYEQIWPVIAEKRLEESGNNHIDLVKAGIQGMDTRSEFILLQRLLKKDDYDVVVVGFAMNDLYTNSLYGIDYGEENITTIHAGQGISAKRRLIATSWFETGKRVFLPSERKNSVHLLTLGSRIALSSPVVYCKLYFASRNKRDYLTIPLPPAQENKLRITKMLFEKMANELDALGKELIVLSIPQQSQVLCFEESKAYGAVDVTFYDWYFANVAKQRGFSWVRSLGAFNKSNDQRGQHYYRLDGHLTPAGHQIVAEVFLKNIVPMINGSGISEGVHRLGGN